jgi:hypothetical protein
MTQENRGRIIWAVLLILAGLYLFAIQVFPGLQILSINENTWPLILVGVGAVLLVAGLLTWTPGLMIPACVVGGLGVLMFWQNSTDNWSSWAYAWTLIPGFAGVGILLMHAMQGDLKQGLKQGGGTILFSAIAFLVFASFFGAIGSFGQYWPLLLIGGGVILLAQAVLRRAA